MEKTNRTVEPSEEALEAAFTANEAFDDVIRTDEELKYFKRWGNVAAAPNVDGPLEDPAVHQSRVLLRELGAQEAKDRFAAANDAVPSFYEQPEELTQEDSEL